MLNYQEPEKFETHVGNVLDVVGIFPTIQGEGPFAGRPAIFIRLAGCNLQCPQCDTDYTSYRRTKSINEITAEVYRWHTPLVVITGGEPFRQDISKLVNALHASGREIQIETNGTFYREDFDYSKVTIVCSPKTGSINPKLIPHIKAYKYVGRYGNLDLQDGLPLSALEHPCKPRLARPPEGATVYLQPEDEKDETRNAANTEAVAASCMTHGYIFCLQVHKYIGVP